MNSLADPGRSTRSSRDSASCTRTPPRVGPHDAARDALPPERLVRARARRSPVRAGRHWMLANVFKYIALHTIWPGRKGPDTPEVDPGVAGRGRSTSSAIAPDHRAPAPFRGTGRPLRDPPRVRPADPRRVDDLGMAPHRSPPAPVRALIAARWPSAQPSTTSISTWPTPTAASTRRWRCAWRAIRRSPTSISSPACWPTASSTPRASRFRPAGCRIPTSRRSRSAISPARSGVDRHRHAGRGAAARAGKLGARVAVYMHKDPGQWLRNLAGERIHRAEALEIYAIDRAADRRHRRAARAAHGVLALDQRSRALPRRSNDTHRCRR